MADVGSTDPRSPIRRLFSWLHADRYDLGSVVIFSVLHGALLLATPVAVQALVNNVAFGATAPSIVILAGLLFIGLSLGAVVLAVQTWITEIIQRRLFVRLVADLSERLRKLSWSVRDRYYYPELVNRFFDIVTVQKASSELLLAGLGNVLSVLVGLLAIAFYHPLLLVMALGILALILFIFVPPLGAGVRSAIRESASKYAMGAWLEEISRHPMTFRVPGSVNLVRSTSRRLVMDYIAARRKHYRIVFGQIVAGLALQVLSSTAILGLGGWLVVKGELTLGQLVAAELIVVVVVQSVAKLGKHAETAYDLVAAVDKLGKLIDLETEDETDLVWKSAPRAAASLEVRGFFPKPSHGGGGEPLSFQLDAGKALAITGPHGSGKTILVEHIFALRRSSFGSIVLDGRNIQDIPLAEYRNDVALASEPALLETTIYDNLFLGRGGIETSELHKTLKTAGLLEHLQNLPEGLSTSLSPTGAPLSAGQASRLSIARVLLSRPRLLLIDGLLDDISVPARREILDALFAELDACSLLIVSNAPDVISRCHECVDLGSSGKVIP